MSDARERVEGHRIKVRYLAKQLERLAKADRDDDNAMWCAAIDVRSALMNLTRTGLNTVDADRILNALRDSEGREVIAEGVAFLDGDCYKVDEGGNCVEPSWTFVENGEPDGTGGEIRAALIRRQEAESDTDTGGE